MDFTILDAQPEPGGAWLHGWDSNLRDRNGHVHAGPRLHPLGYGDWTGPASATLIGVGPTARAAVAELLRT